MKRGDKVIFSDTFYEHHKDMTENKNSIFTINFVNYYSGVVTLREFPNFNFGYIHLDKLSKIRKEKLNKLNNIWKHS